MAYKEQAAVPAFNLRLQYREEYADVLVGTTDRTETLFIKAQENFGVPKEQVQLMKNGIPVLPGQSLIGCGFADYDVVIVAIKVDESYVKQGRDSLRISNTNALTQLLIHKGLPLHPWSALQIKLLLNQLAMMDSNNFPQNVGLGEREARVASHLVHERHFGLCHGIGRSGELGAIQPKAAGSSVMMKLTNSMLVDALRIAGLHKQTVTTCLLIPMATGMALTLVFLTLRHHRFSPTRNSPTAPASSASSTSAAAAAAAAAALPVVDPSPPSPTQQRGVYILWPRIDQKSCFKAMVTAGFTPVIVPNVLEGDEIRTNVEWMERFIVKHGAESVLCVYSTTSCFAPRVPDRLVEIAQLCSTHNIPHVINNAYGLQSTKCVHLINEASRVGRVDGAIVAGRDPNFITAVSKMYPGRASNSPTVDLFITFLSLGSSGFKKQLEERRDHFLYLKEQMNTLAQAHGTRLLNTPHNDISLGMSLESFVNAENPSDITFLGSMLFSRCVSGSRVVPVDKKETVSGFQFSGFMAHIDQYPAPYLTVAAALGVTREEIDTFIARADKALTEFVKKRK